MSLPELRETETLGRSVFKNRHANRARNGRVVPEIFLERLDADSISVDRLNYAAPDVLAALSKKTGQRRIPPRDFHGWATLQVGEATSNGRSVTATPYEENVYHADIFLNLPFDAERRDMEKQHATELAALAKWRDAP